MKSFKHIVFSFLFVTLFGCSDNSGPPQADFTIENVAGIYNIASIEGEEIESVDSSGTTVTISNSTSVGDTFQFTFVLNAFGQYTASGQYRMVVTSVPNGGSPVTESSILVIDDSGTFSVDDVAKTITFNSTTNDFIRGLFEVELFNNTTLSLIQETEVLNGGIKTTSIKNISFLRQ